MLLDCSAILLASSLIVITSGIFTSLLTGLRLSLLSSLFKILFSFCLALFNDAKLLDLVSISPSLRALDIVNFSSLLFPPILFDLFSFGEGSPFNRLVALCSASFLFSESLSIKFKFSLKIFPVLVPDLTCSLLNC